MAIATIITMYLGDSDYDKGKSRSNMWKFSGGNNNSIIDNTIL